MIKRKLSIFLNKYTQLFVILIILLANILLILTGGVILYLMSPDSFSGVIDALVSNIKMILDAGFMPEGSNGFTIVAVVIIFLGMLIFSGGTIGYVTNFIGDWMDDIRRGNKQLYLENHLLMINWNSSALEIVVEEFFNGNTKNVLIFVSEDREKIENEIQNRIKELKRAREKTYKVNVFVREGDLYSYDDIIEMGAKSANSIVILSDETMRERKRSHSLEVLDTKAIKILMLVSQLELSSKQNIVVETSNDMTYEMVKKIADANDNQIFPMAHEKLLGRILAQATIMPELNMVYSELMSHKGNEFYSSMDFDKDLSEDQLLWDFMTNHNRSVPVTLLNSDKGKYLYVMGSDKESAFKQEKDLDISLIPIKLNKNYTYPFQNILIVGHNRKLHEMLNCCSAYCTEHGDLLHFDIVLYDSDRAAYIKEKSVETFYLSNAQNTREFSRVVSPLLEKCPDVVLILSDDSVQSEEMDSTALIHLVYIQDILKRKNIRDKIKVIVEINDPAHFDIANNYNVDNIIISNRYTSRLITQIGDDKYLFDFYSDILRYDDDLEKIEIGEFVSKEIYIKPVSQFFEEIPPTCSIRTLIMSVYEESILNNRNLIIGYIDGITKQCILFSGNLDKKTITLKENDKLVVFSNH